MNSIVNAKDLIETLKKSELKGNSRDFLEYLEQMSEEYEIFQNRKMLKIEINTDGDFAIKNLEADFETYYGSVVVNDNESNHEALMRYINSLSFSDDERSVHVLKHFLGLVKEQDSQDCLNHNNFLNVGGNQTIEVQITMVPDFIKCGDININLKN